MLVGEAHITVRAITTGVANDIKKGFNGIDDSIGQSAGRNLGRSFFRGFNSSGSGNIFGKISDGLDSLAPDADAARESFQGLIRKGYYLQTGLSVLFGSIAAVIGSLVALAASAAAAVPSFASLANIMVAMKIGMGVAKFALGGVSQAVQQATQLTRQYGSVAAAVGQQMRQLAFDAESAALAEERAGLALEQARENLLAAQQLPPNNRARREAELAYREADLAYRRAQEQQKQADKAKKKGAQGGANDPYATLTKSQKTFANFLSKLQDQLKVLRESAASGFLPILQTQIEKLNRSYFPVLVSGFHIIGQSVGDATKSITDMLTKAENISKIKTLFGDSAGIIKKIGKLLSEVFDGFLTVLNATNPTANRFLDFLIKKMKDFNKLLKNTDLKAFFQRSGDIAADFGKVFGNIFSGLGSIIEANFGPDSGGQYLLDWLKAATGQWAEFNKTTVGQSNLKKYFQDVAVNAKIIFQTVGMFFKQLSGLASDPKIGETFKVLQQAAPYVGQIFKGSTAAGPAFAEFVVQITRFIALLTDSEAPKIFFDTLSGSLKRLNDFLDTPSGKKILEIHGQIMAVILAFGVLLKTAQFFGKVFIGAIKAIINPFKKVFGFFTKKGEAEGALSWADKLKTNFNSVGKVLKGAGWIALIVGLVTRFKELYDNSKAFRDQIAGFGKMIGDSFKRVGDALGRLWDTLMGLFGSGKSGAGGGLMGVINTILDVIIQILIPVISGALTFIANILTFAIDSVSSILGAFIPGITLLFDGINDMLNGRFLTGFKKVFTGILVFLIGIFQAIVNVVIDAINFIINTLNDAIKSLASTPWVKEMLRNLGIDISNFQFDAVAHVTWAEDAARNVNGLSNNGYGPTRMATGGTVYPSAGGSIVNVAEAGRPERIEPLDENGLSKRDKALIAELSGGGPVVININGSDLDKNELAAEFSRRLAFNMRRGSLA